MSNNLPWQSGHFAELVSQLPCEALAIHREVDRRKQLARVFDPAFPLQIRHFRFPQYREMVGPNWLNWHAHLELIFPLAGAGQLRIGNELVDFQPGDLLLIENFSLHGVESVRSGHHSLVIYFTPDFISRPDGLPCDMAFLAPFYSRPAAMPPVLRSTDRSARKTRLKLEQLLESFLGAQESLCKQIECKFHLCEILLLLRRHFQIEENSPDLSGQRLRGLERLRPLLDKLRAEVASPPRLRDAAALAGLSETAFKMQFRAATGLSYKQHVARLRALQAAHLLRESELPLSEVAATLGFADQSHFTRQFQKYFRQAPLSYRRSALPV